MRLAKTSNDKKQPADAAMLGVGLDNQDGQTRLTRGKNYVLLGGSEQTHEIMQETAVRVNESLDKRGKRLADLETNEFRDILADAVEKIGKTQN